jgi:anti-sigma factor RsiW
MACDRQLWRERIIDHLAHELGEEDAVALEQHLAECPACAEEARRLSDAVEAAAPRREWTVDQRLESRLLTAARAQSRRRGGRPSWTHRIEASLAAFARRPFPAYAIVPLLVFTLASGVWLGRSTGREGGSVPSGLSPSTALSRTSTAHRSTIAPDHARQAGQRFEVTPSDAIALATAVEHDSL